MRNSSVKNISPDILSLLMQAGSTGRADATNVNLEQLQGDFLNQDGQGGDAFENILSMLTMGQGEAGQASEGDVANLLSMLEGKTNKDGKVALEGFVPVAKNENSELKGESDLSKILNSKFNSIIKTDGKNGKGLGEISLDQKTALDASIKNLINKQATSSSKEVAQNSEAIISEDGDLSFLKDLKQNIETKQSAGSNHGQSNKLKGQLSSMDFVGLKEGVSQGKLDNSMQGNKKAIPMSYMGEQNKMLASNVLKKSQSGAGSEQTQMKNNGEFDLARITEMAVQGNQNSKNAKLENLMKSISAKGQLDLKSSNSGDSKTSDMIGKISDYIVKAQFDKNNSLDVTLKHSELGNFQVKVSKEAQGQGLDIVIRPQTAEGQRFFSDNSNAILKGLGESGLKVLDFKVASSQNSGQSMFSENKSDSGSFNQQFKNDGKFGSSQSNDQFKDQNDSQRRSRLWEEARERLETQYA